MTKMKDSGVKWIGQIPEEWELIQNRYLFEYTGKKVGEEFSKYQLLSLTTKGVKERDINDANGKVPESYDNYQTVKKGQMIFCLFDLDCSAVFSGISNFDGMITSAYNVYSATKLADSRYMDYWFQYVFSDRYYKIYSKNVRFTISEETFKSIETPVPPLNAQKNIADFLDKKCGEIDELIAIQEKEIEKLKEYRTSVVFNALTKGLIKERELKDCNLPWISKMPLGWNVCKIKHIAKLETGSTPSTTNPGYFDGKINWFTPGDFKDLEVSDSSRKITDTAVADGYKPYPLFSTLLIGIGGTAGKVSYMTAEGYSNQQITALIPKSIEFLLFAFDLFKIT